MPVVPASTLFVTLVFSSVSCTGGPERSTPFQIPPPWATPLGPAARPTLSLIWTLRISNRLLLNTAAPRTLAEPVELWARVVLPRMTEFSTVTSAGSPVKLNTARPPFVAAAPFGLVEVATLSSILVSLIAPGPSSSIAVPLGPESTEVADVAIERLWSMVTFCIVSGLSPTLTAASNPAGSPSGSVAVAEFPSIVVS
jgi:hypothetical protein